MNEKENLELGELIVEITKGNTSAIGEIYKRVGAAMLAIAKVYLRSEADAEDVVQDCLITIVTKANKFRENKNAKSWITAIVINTAKNKINYYKRHFEEDIELARGMSADFDDTTLMVKEVYSRLTRHEKQLAIYRYWYNCSLAEIASIIRRSKSTAKYQLDKLEEKIKNFYKKD